MERWFTICCKPRQELVAQENLLQQGFRVYFPLIKVKKHRQGKWIAVVEALFPRYISFQVNPFERSISPVRSTRGVVGLVSFDGQPAVGNCWAKLIKYE
jgi:transcriptional antiterminator RfaH